MMIDSSPSPRRPRIGQFGDVQNSPAAATNGKPGRMPHVITVTSGKGGVGKTNLTANLGWLLRQMRRQVLILDADLGLANIDILLGLTPEFNLGHVLSGEKSLNEIITRGPGGLRILPASSGVSSVTELTDQQKLRLLQEMEALAADYDFLLIDTGAGISHNVIYFNLAAQTRLIVVTPEPTSLTDAYAVIKVLSTEYHQHQFKIVANDVTSDAEGLEVFDKLTCVTDRFLNVSLDYLGCVPHDKKIREAVRMQRPFAEVFAEFPAAKSLRKIAKVVAQWESDPMMNDLGLLWRNVLSVPQEA